MVEKVYKLTIEMRPEELKELHKLLKWTSDCTADISTLEIKNGDPDDDRNAEAFNHICDLCDLFTPEMVEIAGKIRSDLFRAIVSWED